MVSGVDFRIPKGEINKLCTQFFKRVKSILDEEAIKYDDKVTAFDGKLVDYPESMGILCCLISALLIE